MSHRISQLNRILNRSGFQLHHASSDPVVGELDLTRKHLRLQKPDSLRWCEQTSGLASTAHLRSLLSLHSFDRVIDVGANVGQFALSLRSLGFAGDIISFEPNPTVLPVLEKKAARDERWHIIPGGVGASEETLTLHDTGDSSFASLLSPNEVSEERFGDCVETRRDHEVPVKPLSAWLRRFEPDSGARTLLKSDTQGFDLEVLKGCSDLLSTIEAVLVELSYQPLYEGAPTHRAVESYLQEQGFALSGIYPISYHPDSLRMIEADGFFVRDRHS